MFRQIKSINRTISYVVKDWLFYSSIPISTFWDLRELTKHCTHIKTPSEYLDYVNEQYSPTPIREEIMWWTQTLEGNPLDWTDFDKFNKSNKSNRLNKFTNNS